jgi:putative tricarboxylic transport membrane protein
MATKIFARAATAFEPALAGQPRRIERSIRGGRATLAMIALMATALAAPLPAAGWEPTKPVEFIVPAGTGGGADQMARLLQGVITKNNLMKQPMIVVNKSGGARTRSLSRFRTSSRRRSRPACRSTGRT